MSCPQCGQTGQHKLSCTAQPGASNWAAGMLGEDPECRYGYPLDQLERLLGDRLADFRRWHSGQTGVFCEGRHYDHDLKQYLEDGCGPHGPVVYRHDVARYLAGHPVID